MFQEKSQMFEVIFLIDELNQMYLTNSLILYLSLKNWKREKIKSRRGVGEMIFEIFVLNLHGVVSSVIKCALLNYLHLNLQWWKEGEVYRKIHTKYIIQQFLTLSFEIS